MFPVNHVLAENTPMIDGTLSLGPAVRWNEAPSPITDFAASCNEVNYLEVSSRHLLNLFYILDAYVVIQF